MEESVFRYQKIPDHENHPLQHCYFGNYYKNAKKILLKEDVGIRVGKDKEEQEYQCVIMDYWHDRAIEQINLSHEMGVEYALEVLHVNNTTNDSDSKVVKVIYRHFEDTVSGWLKKLVKKKLAKASEINKKMKGEVIPITRKLWKLLDKMEKKRISIPKENDDQGYWMPLISGVPLVLNLYEGKENLDLKYPVTIIEKVLGDCKDKSLSWLKEALNFWKGGKPSLYYAGKHPALYDSAEKSRFLALFHRCTVDYGLEAWLDHNNDMKWKDLENRFSKSNFPEVYEKIRNYKNSNPYTRSSDVVRYTRNALAHFEDGYKQTHRKPWNGGEIVEILDEDLAVCSLYYTCAREIIEINQPPMDLTEGRWKKKQARKWKDSKSRQKLSACVPLPAANVFSEAYQPAPLEIYTKEGCNEGWKPVTKEIVADHQLQFRTQMLTQLDRGWKKGREVFNRANPRQRLWTNEVWREDSRKVWREGWKEAEEIENEAYQAGPLEFLTHEGWKTLKEIIEAGQQPYFCIWDDDSKREVWKLATEIIRAQQPPSLYSRRNGRIIGWVDAFEVDRPRKFLTKEHWDEARTKLEKFLASL